MKVRNEIYFNNIDINNINFDNVKKGLDYNTKHNMICDANLNTNDFSKKYNINSTYAEKIKTLIFDEFDKKIPEGFKEIPNLNQRYICNKEGIILNKRSRKEIKGTCNKKGYISISLRPDTKQKKTYSKHRLVAETFIPNPDNKPYINHINSIRNDNRVENLEWVTPLENITHCIRAGRRDGTRKFNKKEIEEIRVKYQEFGKGLRELAREYNTAHIVISHIVNYKTYKEI